MIDDNTNILLNGSVEAPLSSVSSSLAALTDQIAVLSTRINHLTSSGGVENLHNDLQMVVSAVGDLEILADSQAIDLKEDVQQLSEQVYKLKKLSLEDTENLEEHLAIIKQTNADLIRKVDRLRRKLEMLEHSSQMDKVREDILEMKENILEMKKNNLELKKNNLEMHRKMHEMEEKLKTDLEVSRAHAIHYEVVDLLENLLAKHDKGKKQRIHSYLQGPPAIRAERIALLQKTLDLENLDDFVAYATRVKDRRRFHGRATREELGLSKEQLVTKAKMISGSEFFEKALDAIIRITTQPSTITLQSPLE